jgi:sigma-B regulation protein RsbQ
MNTAVNSSIALRNNVKVFGHGTQVLMFGHGFGCDLNTWRLITPAFEEDFKIVLFDYVGAGHSDLSAYEDIRYSSLEGYATDILEICEALELKEVIFIGHSVSSMIGLLAVNMAPEKFSKLVFIGPSPRYLNDVNYPGGLERDELEELLEIMDSNYLGWSSTMAGHIMANHDRPELADGLANSFCSTNPDIAKKFARVTFLSDNRADLSKLRIPSLTIQCKEDFLTNDVIASYIQSITPGNQISLLNSTGHCPHLSDPQGVIDALKPFLQNPSV